jgi:signal transduction histidine kinase
LSGAAHAALLAYAWVHRGEMQRGRTGLAVALALSAILPASLLLSPSGVLTMLIQAALIVAFGAIVWQNVTRRPPHLWFAFGATWGLVLAATALTSDGSLTFDPDWLIQAVGVPDPLALTMLIGVPTAAVALIGTTFYAFYVARLPEVANRALFWVTDTALLMVGIALVGTGRGLVGLLGLVIVLVSTAGMVYAQTSYRVIDMRVELGSTLHTFTLLAITAGVIFAALVLARAAATTNTIILALVALLAAAVYVPIRQLASGLIRRALGASLTDPAEAARRYTQSITHAVELQPLVDSATHDLNALLRVRRSALILVSDLDTPDAVELQMLSPDGRSARGYLATGGDLYTYFSNDGGTIAQFDLEFNPAYKELPEAERGFFRETGLSAYAPILVERRLIGILGCGAKLDDSPFTLRDFQLLATMANQTGTALRNARLVADLRTLNQGMRTLNRSLEDAKEQMEKLDEVKTDFIMIASHELRTPLAQIRGYTDIMDTLNESGMLDPDQAAGMVANLRKASERMEELIAAMLDVSQLDVNAMNLHFTETSLESVMRMAIEPLTDAIRQRKLTLSARGLRSLPIVQADLQRLVQAFRNVILNAIKFTPDGGKIDITAQLQPASEPGDSDCIVVSIRDTGVGIAKENLELIFRKFYRAYDPGFHSTGTYKFMGAGPGLGLTIAQGVIEGHGGEIWAESPGHDLSDCPGATFYVRLPVTPPTDARRVVPFHLGDEVSRELAAPIHDQSQ